MKFSFLFVAGMFAVFTCGMQNGDCVNSFCKTDINDETFCAAESDLLPDTPLLNKPEINSDLSAYFFHLRQNVGANEKGSCGYVAVAMLLSYYDNFLNSDIIPFQYEIKTECYDGNFSDKESPGVLYDETTKEDFELCNISYDEGKSLEKNVEDLSAEDYYKIVESKQDFSLHAKLITIGHELGYYNESNCTTNFTMRKTVIERYFSQKDSKIKDIGFLYNTGYNPYDFMRNNIKQKIDQGYPVLVSLENSKKAGSSHACIAYAYDENYIYLNLGWGQVGYCAPLEKSYDVIHDIMALDFGESVQHKHSRNYFITRDFEGYCSCSCKVYIYKQNPHNYGVKYFMVNENCHCAYCDCKQYIIQAHEYTTRLSTSGTGKYCKYCQYSPGCKIPEHPGILQGYPFP